MGEQGLAFGFLELIEVEVDVGPGDQLGAQLRREVILGVPVEAVG